MFIFEAISTHQIPPARPALADSSRIVSVYFDGQKKIITTDATTVGDALGRMGVQVSTEDLVEPSIDTTIPTGFFNINVYRSRPVVIIDGANVVQARSALQSPRLVATSAGVTIYPEDLLSLQVVNDFVGDNSIGERIIITRATPITLVADGQRQQVRTQATTVQGLIDDKKVPMGAKDTVVPAPSTSLSAGMVVTITRVSDVVVTQDEVLAMKVKTINDPQILKGNQIVKQEGSDGKRRVTYHIYYQNGVETRRETLKVEGNVDPVERIILVGTKVVFDNNVEQWRPLVAKYFPEDVDHALAIMKCESKGDPYAHGGPNSDGSFDSGLMQINRGLLIYGEQIFDPEFNLQKARGKYDGAVRTGRNGWSPWTCHYKV